MCSGWMYLGPLEIGEAQVTAGLYEGETALFFAIAQHHGALVKMILDHSSKNSIPSM
jgi:hypothetical protein